MESRWLDNIDETRQFLKDDIEQYIPLEYRKQAREALNDCLEFERLWEKFHTILLIGIFGLKEDERGHSHYLVEIEDELNRCMKRKMRGDK